MFFIEMIDFAVKHGLVGKQFVLWQDRDLHAVEVDVCGRREIDGLIFPATITMVVEAWTSLVASIMWLASFRLK